MVWDTPFNNELKGQTKVDVSENLHFPMYEQWRSSQVWTACTIHHFEGWVQDYGNSNIFLKPLFRGNLDPFVNNANLGAIAHTSNGT